MPAPLEWSSVAGPKVLLVASLLVVPALAGCASKEEPSQYQPEPVQPGSTSSGSPAAQSPTPAVERPRGTSERWHFHDYWQGSPTITLVATNVTFGPMVGGDGLPALGSLVELPHGTIVPPETGFLEFNVTWPGATAGLVNITYKPADSNDFFVAGEVERGVSLRLNTTESNADVPHRQLSAWKFNLTAKPGGTPPALPPRDVNFTVTATIGRPLFIDPPHLNWWRDGDVIPLVDAAGGEIRTARTPATNATLPGIPGAPDPASPPRAPKPEEVATSMRVAVDAGRIVPEGAKSIVAILNWSSPMSGAALALRYQENNYPSEGPMELAQEGAGSRVYVLSVAQAQTDTTYSNRTTWEFRVVPEGGPAAAFDGSFTLVAWATRYEPADAVAAILAPAS